MRLGRLPGLRELPDRRHRCRIRHARLAQQRTGKTRNQNEASAG